MTYKTSISEKKSIIKVANLLAHNLPIPRAHECEAVRLATQPRLLFDVYAQTYVCGFTVGNHHQKCLNTHAVTNFV